MKNFLKVNGLIQKNDGSEFNEEEVDKLVDSVIMAIENNEAYIASSFELTTEESLLEELNEELEH